MLNNISILHLLATTSAISWLILFFFRGQFWRADQRLTNYAKSFIKLPEIVIIIPARNEETLLGASIGSLLGQTYAGLISIIIIDDNSDDSTPKIVQSWCDKNKNMQLINGTTTPHGWTGKIWAMAQGVELAKKRHPNAEYYLFTDSDILHHPDNLSELIYKALNENLVLVSLMVKLRCKSIWEIFLIPAYIFFFQKLYPFSWVNDPKNITSAAAGGCMLVNCQELEKAGGFQVFRSATIDDCAMALIIKRSGPIWLGLTESTKSSRKYQFLHEITQMVCRTAFVQLKYSVINLLGTIIGMVIVYTVPLICIIIALISKDILLLILGFMGWIIMFVAYIPTLKLYTRPVWEAGLLPISALLYTVMTIMSAYQYRFGKKPSWKGRSLKKAEKNVPDKKTR